MGVRRQFPVGATMGHLVSLLGELEEQPVGGETGLGSILETLPGRLNRRSLVILISDCLDHAQPLSRPCRPCVLLVMMCEFFKYWIQQRNSFPLMVLICRHGGNAFALRRFAHS